MSGTPKYIIGELVELGTPAGSEQPRALIHCEQSDIAAVKYAPILRRVAIVPLEQLNGSDAPPIVEENRRLREQADQNEDLVYCLELCRAALEHHEETAAQHGAKEMHRNLYEMSGIAIRCLAAHGAQQDAGYWERVDRYLKRMQAAREAVLVGRIEQEGREAREEKGGAA